VAGELAAVARLRLASWADAARTVQRRLGSLHNEQAQTALAEGGGGAAGMRRAAAMFHTVRSIGQLTPSFSDAQS
jgi:hypothetical protein